MRQQSSSGVKVFEAQIAPRSSPRSPSQDHLATRTVLRFGLWMGVVFLVLGSQAYFPAPDSGTALTSASWLFSAEVNGDVGSLELVSIEPAVITAGEEQTVHINGLGLGAGTDVQLISGGAYLESVTTFGAEWGHYNNDIVTVGNFAYLVSDFNNLRILDIQDPVRPVQLSSMGLSLPGTLPGRLWP